MNNETRMKNLSRLLWDDEMIGTRFSLAIAEFFCAIMLFTWGNGHDLFLQPSYKQLSLIMSPEAWGTLLLVSASTQVLIILNGDMNTRFARHFATVNAGIWVYIGSTSLLFTVYPTPSLGGEFALACAAFWIWVRPYILAKGQSNE